MAVEHWNKMFYLKMSFVCNFAMKDARLYFYEYFYVQKINPVINNYTWESENTILDNKIDPSMQGTLPTAVF